MIALNTGKHKPIIFQMSRFQEVKILIPEKYGQYEELAISQLMEKRSILPFPRTVTNLSCSFFFSSKKTFFRENKYRILFKTNTKLSHHAPIHPAKSFSMKKYLQ